ncbi:MAG: hypothetical protein QM755_19305 [Luteolibacter sp.]
MLFPLVKTRFLLLLLASASLVRGGDFIRQIQTVNGQSLIYDLPITGDSGEIVSKPIPSTSAVFQLYTSVTSGSTTTLLKLDEKTVGTYLPTVTAVISSEDPSVPARTRADRPYGVTLTVSGLLATADVPAAAKQVQVRRSYALYDATTKAVTATTAKGEYADSFQFQTNGTFSSTSVLQRLPVDQPTQAMGEESFTVYTYPDASTVQGQLAKATVKIWPVAGAVISGIVADKTYVGAPANVKLQLTNLYPKSSTYVQVYKGAPALGTVGTILPSSAVTYDTAEPQAALLALSDIDKGLKDDGYYTMEVLTITPFNGGKAERLAYTSFYVDRTIKANTAVTTLE